ncbi:hypothetical protein WISP_72699 [Willisornis vidua]|uniref:Uncharacterized protein n=1 Tax=Willisornis vidua TaxID=1566151 RepID=A0ABQ9D736_9PASS|nr:hypothetical protein WISP_72699 [Willisornis vidua]
MPQYKMYIIKSLQCLQWTVAKMMKGHKGNTYKEHLRSLGFFSLEKRRLRCDLIAADTLLKVGNAGRGADFLSLETSSRTQGNEMKLHQGKFRLDIRKRFFTGRLVGHWNRFPREVITAPSLSEFKKHLNDSLSLIFRQSCEEQGAGLDDPYGFLPTQVTQ